MLYEVITVLGPIWPDPDDPACRPGCNTDNGYLRAGCKPLDEMLPDQAPVFIRISIQLVERHDQRLVQFQQRLQGNIFVAGQVTVVITSYSIHYTKLYDACHEPQGFAQRGTRADDRMGLPNVADLFTQGPVLDLQALLQILHFGQGLAQA